MSGADGAGPRLAVFGYGSLVSRDSIAETLGHRVPDPIPARLPGWRRRWSIARDNELTEKSFARIDGVAFRHVLGLNIEHAHDAAESDWPNGALIELREADLERLDERELRYDRVDVTAELAAVDALSGFERVYAFTAKPQNASPTPPAGAIIVAAYVDACRAAFGELGQGEWERFEETTGPYPAPIAEVRLTRDEIPSGNPRAW